MGLKYLAISDLRNIKSVSLKPGPGLNFVFGPNGSGKTSLLEAIYLLSRGRSFRSAHSRRIIRYQKHSLTVFGRSQNHSGLESNLGLQIKEGRFRAKVDGQYLKKSSDLAAILPLLLISPNGDKLINGSPRQRRRFLDWGLFHVEHGFLSVWQRYNRILSQRNVLLKQGRRAELASWNQQLSQVCEEFDCLRKNYVDQLIPIIQQYFEQLMNLKGVKFHYQNGWAQGVGFSEALAANIENDLKLGFTQRGPHRADLVMKIDGRSAAQYLSGGQQKLAACALMLAQASLYLQKTGHHCLILVDDLSAELDSTHRATFINLLDAMGGQVFITATDPALLDLSAYKAAEMFHVEHGSIISK